MDKIEKNITKQEKNESKLNLEKLFEIENLNSNLFKNAIILQLLDSNELLYVIQEKKENSKSYLIELYDLINKKVLITQKLQDYILHIILLDNNDIAYFVDGGTKIEGDILTVLEGSVKIINITNPKKKIMQLETPELESHSLFCNLFPLTIKDKSGVGVAFDFEIYIFLKSNGEKYENFKKIENFGTLSDYFIYKNYFVSYGFDEFHYYDLDKNFELRNYDKLKSEDININTFVLFAKSRLKIKISDHIFIYPFNKKNILFFDADKCKIINILEIKGNEFNVKSEFEVKQMLFINNYLLLLIQILSNYKEKLLKYSIDEATMSINYISSLDLGNSIENSISFKKNLLYIVKYDNYQENKKEKLEIYNIDI